MQKITRWSVSALIFTSLCFVDAPLFAAKKKEISDKQISEMMDNVASVRKVAPIYPLELLLEGKTGQALVQFTIDTTGQVMLPQILEATDPAFGEALVADIEANEFLPPRFNGKAKSILTKQRFEFKGEAALPEQEKLILAELKKTEPAILTVEQLESPLVPKHQPSPAFPFVADIEGLSGEAVVEFILDHNGRARFPKVVSASLKDFGWAAATAINRWKYLPSTKNGEKVFVRVVATVKFDNESKKITW